MPCSTPGGQDGQIMMSATTSAAFDVMLIVHVLLAIIAVVVVGAAYVAAASLGGVRAGDAWPEGPKRFFTPGPDIAGRMVYGVPLTGLVLVGLSGGEFSVTDPFIQAGFGCSIIAIVMGEWLVFPATTRLGSLLADAAVVPTEASWRADLGRLRWGVDAMVLVLLVAAVLMVAKP